MDRRDSLKTMLIGGLAGGLLVSGCNPADDAAESKGEESTGQYGRTDAENAHDTRLRAQNFFTESELVTVAILCDLILPASPSAGSATQAGVPEFIEFIVKDITDHQTPVRGGLMWLDNRALKKFGNVFSDCSESQQKELLDEIAWPEKTSSEVEQGVEFFNRIRNLVLTGYYTSEMGIKDLGYQGNVPNVWDGVPESVLAKHDLFYDPEWLKKCIDQETRNEIAQWDDNGNLLN